MNDSDEIIELSPPHESTYERECRIESESFGCGMVAGAFFLGISLFVSWLISHLAWK